MQNGTKWEVGFYTPQGEFMAESSWEKQKKAREVVHWLNGGNIPEGFPGHADNQPGPKSKPLNK